MCDICDKCPLQISLLYIHHLKLCYGLAMEDVVESKFPLHHLLFNSTCSSAICLSILIILPSLLGMYVCIVSNNIPSVVSGIRTSHYILLFML